MPRDKKYEVKRRKFLEDQEELDTLTGRNPNKADLDRVIDHSRSDQQKDVSRTGKPTKPKAHIATFRGIPKDLHEMVKKIAEENGVTPGELARYFLEWGLSRIEAGEVDIEPEFIPGGFTLYPEERRKRVRRKAYRKPKALQKPRSYYGVPRTVVKAVLEKGKEIGVTQGELARHLLEQGVKAYRSGALEVNPMPLRQIATLYPEDIQEA